MCNNFIDRVTYSAQTQPSPSLLCHSPFNFSSNKSPALFLDKFCPNKGADTTTSVLEKLDENPNEYLYCDNPGLLGSVWGGA